MMVLGPILTLDHQVIEDTRATQRYVRKRERITAHLGRVAAEERAPSMAAATRRHGNANLLGLGLEDAARMEGPCDS